MGAETALVAYADTSALDVLRSAPVLDRKATIALVERLFPDRRIEPIGDELLCHARNPAEDVAYVGCYPGLDLVCSWQLVADRPSGAARQVLAGPRRRAVVLHAMHAAIDWCSFGLWTDGRLVRALSASPGGGIVENTGDRLPFEEPYWVAACGCEIACYKDLDVVVDPLPFRPIALGERALQEYFGFRCDGDYNHDDVDPEVVPLVGYRIGQRRDERDVTLSVSGHSAPGPQAVR